MLIKLKKKFVIISMSLVSILLIIIFSSIYFLNYRSLNNETSLILYKSINGIDSISNNIMNYENINYLPIFIYDITGEYKFVDSNLDIIIDEQTKVEILDLISKKYNNTGFMPEYGLKYYKFESIEDGRKFVALLFDERIIQLNNLRDNLFFAFFISFFILLIVTNYLAKWALKPVENSWKFQEQFIADASHELKTPLTVILANIKILKEISNSNHNQLKWLENTNDEAIRMKGLIEEMLYLAKPSNNNDNLNFEKINFSDLVEEVMLTFESIAFEKRLELKFDYFNDNIYLEGNRQELKRLLIILVDNACKYSEPENDITIELYKKDNKAIFKINSIGNIIKKENYKKIFERFIRESESRARYSEGGYGLGLAIAKKIVETHNGKIDWAPFSDIGNTFIVELEA